MNCWELAFSDRTTGSRFASLFLLCHSLHQIAAALFAMLLESKMLVAVSITVYANPVMVFVVGFALYMRFCTVEH